MRDCHAPRACPPARLARGLVFTALVVCPALLLLAAGCGGGGGGGGNASPTPTPTPAPTPTPIPTTRATFRVEWGARSRAGGGAATLPASALSVAVTFAGAAPGGGDVRVVLNRDARLAAYGQDYATIGFVRVGTHPVRVRCHAQPDAEGSVVGIADTAAAVAPDGSGLGTVAVEGTVAAAEVAEGQALAVGERRELEFAARAANGDLVPVTRGAAFFEVAAGGERLRVGPDQSAEALRPGTADVVVRVDGRASAPRAVRVTSPAAVTVSPEALQLSTGESRAFAAQVTGAPETGVTWSVAEGAAGGAITADGVYTAPQAPGTYHAVATSQYDPEKKALVTVVVVPRGGVTVPVDFGNQGDLPVVIQ